MGVVEDQPGTDGETALGEEVVVELTQSCFDVGVAERGAEPIDLESFRRGHISKNELIRRVKGVSARPQGENYRPAKYDAPPPPEPKTDIASEYVGITDPAKGGEEILRWLREDPVRRAYAVEILKEARAALAGGEEKGTLPRDRAPAGTSASEIIRRCRPDPVDFDMDIAWCGRWLALSAFHLVPNVDVRRQALDMVADAVDRPSFGGSTLAA